KLSDVNSNESLKDIFNKLVPDLNYDFLNDVQFDSLFESFDFKKTTNFSNNLLALMSLQMKYKLSHLNISSKLTLKFLLATLKSTKFSMKVISSKIFKEILSENKNPKDILKHSFPYNIFIFSLNVLNKEDFLYQKDIFQKEMDKFDFIATLSEILFSIVHFQIYPPEFNIPLNTNISENYKLFFLNRKENLFVSKEAQKNFLEKTFKTTLYNLGNFLINRMDYGINKERFEMFIFHNIYLFLFLIIDSNNCIKNFGEKPSEEEPLIEEEKKEEEKKEEPKNSNVETQNEEEKKSVSEILKKNIMEYNDKSIKVFKRLCGISLNPQINSSSLDSSEINVKEEISNYNKEIYEDLNQKMLEHFPKCKSFIEDFYLNFDKFTVPFKLMGRMFIIYLFHLNPGICEMICLSSTFIDTFIKTINYFNAFDLTIAYFIGKTQNFYITLKHLNLKVEDLVLNILDVINKFIQEETMDKLTFSRFYCLIFIRQMCCKLNEPNMEIINQLADLNLFFLQKEIKKENFVDNLILVSLSLQIILEYIRNIDSPVRLIINLLNQDEILTECYNNHVSFFNENFKDQKEVNNWEKFKKIFDKVFKFLGTIKSKVKEEGILPKYSDEHTLVRIITKCNFKDESYEYLGSDESDLFTRENELFLYATLRSFDDYGIVDAPKYYPYFHE
ncbi:MAG: hypothetical protein MJ252_15590, partial [archaeon]|nr:hypothetical protein [archaeon]